MAMSIISKTLTEEFSNYKIGFDEDVLSKFEIYADMLINWNNRMNLTAITDPYSIAIKHFLDSALLLDAFSMSENATIIDIGTGAGFPGVPVKILRNDANLTLLDSLNKRLVFLGELCDKINIEADIIHSRAEEGSKSAALREKFDVATSRAVAPLNILLEYCLPYVKVGGAFIAMKGPGLEDEIKNSKNAMSLLGAEIAEVKSYTLPDGGRREILILKKVKKISAKYPRHGSKIQKKPL